MYMVYWTEITEHGRHPKAQEFGSDQMTAAMKFMEELRARQRARQGVCFIALSSENPDSVGHAGVADPPADYNWKKRRK